MHDIICPHCGERYIARDTSFDLSEFILPLLADSADDARECNFKYFVDEEVIVCNAKAQNIDLFCANEGGPGVNGDFYIFPVTNWMLLKYIFDATNAGHRYGNITPNEFVLSIKSANGNYTQTQADFIQHFYYTFIGGARQDIFDFEIKSMPVKKLIKMLIYILDHKDKCVNIELRMYSHNKGEEGYPDYKIADRLYVRHAGQVKIVSKCCRSCGAALPREFGYFKMNPVVLMGSHYAGKTSYLLALLHSVRYIEPFCAQRGVRVTTLTDDPDLEQFEKNIENFRKGKPPLKTDFSNVPILNLRVGNMLYSFIDWPGEMFIDASKTHQSNDFAFNDRRAVYVAKHFLCFLEPRQVDDDLKNAEENVSFDPIVLAQRFNEHINMSTKTKDVIYVVNKFDLYDSVGNASLLNNLISNISETDFYDGITWNKDKYIELTKATKDFLASQISSFIGAVHEYKNLETSYFPCAPYGIDADSNNEKAKVVIYRTHLAGLPLLKIMNSDGLI